jgi:hypothetical protein
VSFTKTQARHKILLPPPPPPLEQRPDWQAASRCHILSAGRSKPRRIRGAPTLQRTKNKTLPLRWAEQRREAQNSENGLGSESRSLREIVQRTSKTLSREAKPRVPHTRKCDQSASSKTPYPTEHNKGYRRSRVQDHIEASLRARDTEHKGTNLQLLTVCEASIVQAVTQRAITVEERKSKRRDRFLEGKQEAVPPTVMIHTENSFAKRVLEKLT